jgi:hypothetical protein
MRMNPAAKTKEPLNVTIDKEIKEKAIAEAKKKNIPISRLIENFLDFFVNPRVYCYKCGEEFRASEATTCMRCNSMICPKCNTCICGFNEESAIAIFHMRRVYEDLVAGRVKQK